MVNFNKFFSVSQEANNWDAWFKAATDTSPVPELISKAVHSLLEDCLVDSKLEFFSDGTGDDEDSDLHQSTLVDTIFPAACYQVQMSNGSHRATIFFTYLADPGFLVVRIATPKDLGVDVIYKVV